MPFSSSEKSRDMRLTSRTITSLFAAVGTGFALSTMISAPVAVATECVAGEVIIDGRCTDLQNANNPPVLPEGAPGTIQCTQHSCVYRENG
jgi:hypothetical protein